MNANELMQVLEIGGAWEDDSGNLHNVPTGEFEQALSEAIKIIERTRIRETAAEPPTREDADKDGLVLAYDKSEGDWNLEECEEVANNRGLFTKWTQLPEVTPNETKEEQH